MFNPTINITMAQMMGHKPGDPCPRADCKGLIREILLSWTEDYFGGDAICDLCGEAWTIAEEVPEDDEENGKT